jgi:hypothetical protein
VTEPRQQVFPFFVGSGRSGTTLVQAIFSAHPDLAVVHESQFIPRLVRAHGRRDAPFDPVALLADLPKSPDFQRMNLSIDTIHHELSEQSVTDVADAIRLIFGLFAEAKGKRLYGDKTPGYVMHMGLIARLFPESRFVHVVRDGRDVALSYLRTDFGPENLSEGALYWKRRVCRGRATGEALGPDRYMEMRYEDLVQDPEQVLRGVSTFIGIEFDERMLRFHESGDIVRSETAHPSAHTNLSRPIGARVNDWRSQFSTEEAAVFDVLAGSTLEQFGYARGLHNGRLRHLGIATLAWIRWQMKRLRTVARRSPARPQRRLHR